MTTRTLARRLERLEERVTPTNMFPDITVEFVSAQEKRVTSRLVISNGTSTWTDLADPKQPTPSTRTIDPDDGPKRTCIAELRGEDAMSNLCRRLKKLETLMTDASGLVPSSPRWWAYWTERLHKFIARDDDARGCKIPLEVIRAYVQTAEPDSDE